MQPFRVLHIDDDPALRDIVELSLGFDPAFSPASCGSGRDALALAAEWKPDLILCDVMMPEMDGPETLARLRSDATTAEIPIMFMTANPGPDEIAHYKSLGAVGVIPKPFEPSRLAESVRQRCQCLAKDGLIATAPGDFNIEDERDETRSIYMDAAAEDFSIRLRSDALTLANLRDTLSRDGETALHDLQSCAHKLAGAAGIFGHAEVSKAASALETAAKAGQQGRQDAATITPRIDALIACIGIEARHA